MDDKENEILQKHGKFIKKALKAILYTFVIFILSMFGVTLLLGFIFRIQTSEQSDVWLIISFCVGIIFTIFYCTFTIVEEIRKKK